MEYRYFSRFKNLVRGMCYPISLAGDIAKWLNEAGGDILRHSYITQVINDQLRNKGNVSKLISGSQAFPVISSSLEYFKGIISPK
jgi:hypothetical protein